MKEYIVKEHYRVYKFDISIEKKFRQELSKQLIEKFQKGPFDQETIRDIVVYSLNYYIGKFLEICHQEKSVAFYQFIFILHEQATELVYKHNGETLSVNVDWKYIALYRRILKFILETACDVKMITGEKVNNKFLHRIEGKIDALLFLGEMILSCVSFYAEQAMIEDVAEVKFDNNDEYVFSRRHHYEFIFKHIIEEFGGQLEKTVVDDSGLAGFEDLTKAIEEHFHIKYKELGHLIASIHKELEPKGGFIVGVGWETLPQNLHRMFNVPLDICEQFFSGLRLDRNNKMGLLDLACKPYNLNRYIYRPILIWNIDGNDYALIGKNSWSETFVQLASNAIPWGKAAPEWMKNIGFKKFVHEKEDDHDRWLDDEVENKLKALNLLYDRNVKRINHDDTFTNIDVEGLGEIDFIIVNPKTNKIYIADCKHLLGRYDIVNQKNDFNAFCSGKKPYNETMSRKIEWFNENKQLISKHFQKKYPNYKLDISEFIIEGIFIINTPTFYMYNSKYRIYTVSQITTVLNNQFKDRTFYIINDDDKSILNIEYPYFQKPVHLTFDPFNENAD